MKKLTKFYIAGMLLIALAVGFVANRSFAQTLPTFAQFSANRDVDQFGTTNGLSVIGRFQMVSNAKGVNYILDTATGKCWVQTGKGINSKEWEEISPKWATMRPERRMGTMTGPTDTN